MFAFLADGEGDKKFSARVIEISKTTDGPSGKGTIYKSTVRDAGFKTKREFELTEVSCAANATSVTDPRAHAQASVERVPEPLQGRLSGGTPIERPPALGRHLVDVRNGRIVVCAIVGSAHVDEGCDDGRWAVRTV